MKKLDSKLALTVVSVLLGLSGASMACTYTVVGSSPKIGFIAYKTTEKVGVEARFTRPQLSGLKPASSIPKLLNGTRAWAQALEFDAGNEARNLNIGAGFFKLFRSPKIQGRLKDAKGDDQSGQVTLLLEMNRVKRELSLTYRLENTGELRLEGVLEVMDFALGDALHSLNTRCLDLHKGKDGVSKTWSEVGLRFSATVEKKNCQ